MLAAGAALSLLLQPAAISVANAVKANHAIKQFLGRTEQNAIDFMANTKPPCFCEAERNPPRGAACHAEDLNIAIWKCGNLSNSLSRMSPRQREVGNGINAA